MAASAESPAPTPQAIMAALVRGFGARPSTSNPHDKPLPPNPLRTSADSSSSHASTCCAHCTHQHASPPSTSSSSSIRPLSIIQSLQPRTTGPAPQPLLDPNAAESTYVPSQLVSQAEQFSTIPHSYDAPLPRPPPEPKPKTSPSYEKFLSVRRRKSTSSSKLSAEYDPSVNPLSQKSLITRLNWTLQAFGGVTAPVAASGATVPPTQPRKIDLPPKRQSTSVEQKRLSSSSSSIASFYSKDVEPVEAGDRPEDTTTATHKVLTPAVKPFANRRVPPPAKSKLPPPPSVPEPFLSTVQEEDDYFEPATQEDDTLYSYETFDSNPYEPPPADERPATDETLRADESLQTDEQLDDMGIMRNLAERISRAEPATGSMFRTPPRPRPEISLPQLIHTTNTFVNGPAVRPTSTTSNISTTPSTPTSDAPSLSHTSSRSSSEGTPCDDKFARVAPNHLTRYFAPTTEEKAPSIVSVMPASPSGSIDSINIAPPALPDRAPSHSKREHLRLARQRSARSSLASNSPRSPQLRMDEPFSAELAQLAQMAEEARARDALENMLLESVDEGCEIDYKRYSTNSYSRMLVDLEASRWAE